MQIVPVDPFLIDERFILPDGDPTHPTTLRREDRRLLLGAGQFAADVELTDPLYVSFVRSVVPRGLITECDMDEARAMPGVLAVFSGADVADLGALSVNEVIERKCDPGFPILVQRVVSSVGEAVAAVLATSRLAGEDAAETVYLDIDDSGALPLAEVAADACWGQGDVAAEFARAAHVVEVTIQHPRLAPSPMETRSIAVEYHPETDGVTIWLSTQTPHRAKSELAGILAVDPTRIRVIARDVGGAFGMKASLYPEEIFAVWAAFRMKRSTRWTASRSEDFQAASHGRGACSTGKLAIGHDGRFLALQARIESPLGAWLPNSALVPAWNSARLLPCGYAIETIDVCTTGILSNTAPMGIYRGAGRPEANMLMERLVDKAAAVTGMDPLEIRGLNLLPASAMPKKTATGNVLDSGNYAGALDLLAKHADYPALVSERDRRRKNGELVGLGVAFYLEPSGTGWETARVTWNADGTALVASGSSSQGHGRETAFAGIASEALGIAPGDIIVQLGDTKTCPTGIGALASRSTAIGGSAVLTACREIMTRLQAGETAPLSAKTTYTNQGEAWGYGAYMVMMAINPATGVAKVERAICLDDTGVIVDPKLVEGQILGGFAQGLGEAMMEAVIYDSDGQLITGSFSDYALPRAHMVPRLEIHKTETPSPFNAIGAKGVGEAGTIGAPPAILNAAIDALRPLGVEDLQMPLTSQNLWRAINNGKSK